MFFKEKHYDSFPKIPSFQNIIQVSLSPNIINYCVELQRCFDGICPVCQLVGLPGKDDGARQYFGKQRRAMDFLLPAQLGRNKVTLFNCEKEVRPTGKGLGFIIIPMSASKTHLKSK